MTYVDKKHSGSENFMSQTHGISRKTEQGALHPFIYYQYNMFRLKQPSLWITIKLLSAFKTLHNLTHYHVSDYVNWQVKPPRTEWMGKVNRWKWLDYFSWESKDKQTDKNIKWQLLPNPLTPNDF